MSALHKVLETRRTFPSSSWPKTDWDQVLALRDPAAYEEALGEICRTYHGAFLRSLRRNDPTKAEDLVQDFVLYLLRKNPLALADPARGRFRDYARTMMVNFARKEHRRGQSQRRGAGAPHFALTDEAATAEAPGAESFDHEWARELVGRVVESFKRESADPEILRLALGGLAGYETPGPEETYEAVSGRLGRPAGTLRSDVSRTRERFRQRLRQEVALTTVRSGIDEELRYILNALLAHPPA
jgi:DNA-directed RNA polymerase specialized sigma24 family protein